jgi:hypothetical protein
MSLDQFNGQEVPTFYSGKFLNMNRSIPGFLISQFPSIHRCRYNLAHVTSCFINLKNTVISECHYQKSPILQSRDFNSYVSNMGLLRKKIVVASC